MDFTKADKYDLNRVTRGIDMAALCAVLGIELDASGMGLCPFHDNTNSPAFSTFIGEDGKPRFFCHGSACGKHGDALDLVMARLNLSHSEAFTYLIELLDAGMPAPDLTKHEAADFSLPVGSARERAGQDSRVIVAFLADRHSPIPADWLIETFRLGVGDRDEILIPHYAAGEDQPQAVKVRAGADKWGLKGSRLSHLYGEWRDRGKKNVLICEGESDAWTLAWLYRHDPVDVLALPRGVGAAVDPAWLDRLRDRNVTLIFDADDAARWGLRRWWLALAGTAASVRIAHLPEGEDVSSAGPDTVTSAVEIAFQCGGSYGVLRTPRGYARRASAAQAQNGQGDTPITDWTMDVLTRIHAEGALYYDVRVPGRKKPVRLAHTDLRTSDSFARWANPLGLAFTGRGADTQELLRLLEAEAVFVPRLTGVDVAGWHEGAFVLPESDSSPGTLGAPRYSYVTPGIDARWDIRLRLTEGEVVAHVADLLARLNDPWVTTPVLGWVAAAPLRALCAQFPTLAVMGSAGSGKTTLVQEVLRTFGLSDGTPQSVANTTAHGVWGQVGSTNALPVWFDEYRFGARLDGMAALDQAIRDAWNGSVSMRGGAGENKSALQSYAATAPICVTGESAFTEQSHAERMVIVTLNREGRNGEALTALQRTPRSGFGLRYLTWLLDAHKSGRLPKPPALPERMAQSVAVVEWGYRIFCQHAKEIYGVRLPAFDGRLIEHEQQVLTARLPILEALRAFMHETDSSRNLLVWDEGADICVRVQKLGKMVAKDTSIVLPGNDEAVARWLQERYPGAGWERGGSAGQYLRLPGARAEVLAQG